MTKLFHLKAPLRHDSPFRIAWNISTLVATFSFTFMITYRIVFKTFAADWVYYILNSLFLVDMLLGFVTSAKRGHLRLESFPAIGAHYLRSWFVIDLLAFLPFELIPVAIYGGIPTDGLGSSIYLACQALTLVKVCKSVRIFDELQEALGIAPGLRRLVSFAFWFFQALHLMALGWILIGASESFRPHFDQYLRAFYWVTSTIATIGYGDYTPNHDSNLQIGYTIMVQLFGVAMYSFIIANVSSLIANIDGARAKYQQRLDEVNAFLKANKIPSSLQGRVRDYYSYLWAEKGSVSSSSIVDDLAPSLGLEILLFQNADMLRKVEVFKQVEDLFIREAVKLLNPIIFLPGEYIMRQGEYGDRMYFLTSGSVAVEIGDKELARLGPGSLFGEAALIGNERRNASVRSLDYGNGYELSQEHFNLLRRRYPEFDQQVLAIVKARKASNASAE